MAVMSSSALDTWFKDGGGSTIGYIFEDNNCHRHSMETGVGRNNLYKYDFFNE